MNYSEISQKIKVIDWDLTKSGLLIQYELDGKDLSLIANPEQTADILKSHGLIEDYSGAENEVTIEIDLAEAGVTQMTWDELIINQGFRLSQREALNIVIKVEQDKISDREINRFAKVPELLRSIQ